MRRNKRAITHIMYLSSSCNGNALLLILLKLNTLLTKFFYILFIFTLIQYVVNSLRICNVIVRK